MRLFNFSVTKKTCGRVWENQETLLLLQKWGGRKYRNEVNVLYKKEAYMTRNKRFFYKDRDEDACKTRIHTLVRAYRSYKEECEKTRNGTPKRKPAFFDEVDEFFSKKPYSKQKVVVNSSKIIIEADNEEEDHENIENYAPNEEWPFFSGGTSGGSNNKTASKFPQPNKAKCLTGEL